MFVGNEKTIRFGQFFDSVCRRKSIFIHETIRNLIGTHLQSEDFEVVYEFQDIDEDSSYRYDIIAQKKKELWIVEIKDEINIRNFGQIYAYCLQAKKENPGAKVWLGTDCLNYWNLISGEIGEMVQKLMKTENLGIILVNKELIWKLSTFTDLLNIEERGHLCDGCNYCDGFTIDGGSIKILIAVGEGYKKEPKIVKSDADKIYDFSIEEFRNIKKEFINIKNKMGKSNFEKKTGIKIE